MSKTAKNRIAGCGKRSLCPVTNTLDLIGDKWTLLIIRDMLILGRSRFGEFLESGEGISTNILTDRLKKLEKYGLITKKAYRKNPVRYEYSVTKTGESLRPLLVEMIKWGGEHIEGAYRPTKTEIENAAGKNRKQV